MRALADLMPHASPGERSAANKLVRGLLARVPGSTLSVQDGEDWTVARSTSAETVLAALCTTGMDRLRWRKPDGIKIGTLLLVWGNSPDELVADYSAPTDPALDALSVVINEVMA